MINADGSGLRKVTTEPETYPFDVGRSPVGGLYVYWGACPDIQNFELCLVSEDGTDRRPLSARSGHVGTTEDDSPAWSPDGSKIVFRRRPNDGPGTSSQPGDLYMVGVDGTGETRLTSEPAQARVVKASGGPSTVLAPGGTVNESPSFSHDGRRIAFSSPAPTGATRACSLLVGPDGDVTRVGPGSRPLAATSAWFREGPASRTGCC